MHGLRYYTVELQPQHVMNFAVVQGRGADAAGLGGCRRCAPRGGGPLGPHGPAGRGGPHMKDLGFRGHQASLATACRQVENYPAQLAVSILLTAADRCLKPVERSRCLLNAGRPGHGAQLAGLAARSWQRILPAAKQVCHAGHHIENRHSRWTVQSLPRLVMRLCQSHDPSICAAVSRGGSGRRRGAAAPAPTSTRSTCCAASCARYASEH